MNHQEAVEKTITMLKEYQARHRQIEALRYRMLHPSTVTKNEIIGQMSMPGASDIGGRAASGRISDKTMYIALNYEERVSRMNEEEAARIAEKLFELEEREHRLNFHIGLLPANLSELLKAHYIKGLTWGEIADVGRIPLKTLESRRSKAVDMLADLLFLGEGYNG